MKLNLEIDCTPDEARAFFGLPDLKPLQNAMLAQVEQRMLDAVGATSPEALMKAWLPLAPWSADQMQGFMSAMMGAFRPGSGKGGPTGG